MNKPLLILLGLLALALLGYLCTYKNHAPAIQDDITSRASSALTNENILWANVTVDGRNIILTGVAPDQAAKDKAEAVAKIYGYNLVDNQITLAAGAPETATQTKSTDSYQMTAIKDANGKITLRGYVSDSAMRTQIITMVADNFGENNIIDQLEIVPGAPDYWLPAVKAGMAQLDFLDQGQSEWRNENLKISGRIASAQVKQQMQIQLEKILPGDVSVTFDLTAAMPVSVTPEPVATQTAESVQMTAEEKMAAVSCQDQFAELLARNIIVFQTNSAEISTDSYGLLDSLTAIAGECPTANIQIEGHTDSSGSDSYNQDLSQRRAQSVVDYLSTMGVDSTRLTAVGFGEEVPVADNNTDEGRATNRRIEFNIKGL